MWHTCKIEEMVPWQVCCILCVLGFQYGKFISTYVYSSYNSYAVQCIYLLQIEMYVELAVSYLIEAYNYCIFCGILYESLEDLQSNCPGPCRADHDD